MESWAAGPPVGVIAVSQRRSIKVGREGGCSPKPRGPSGVGVLWACSPGQTPFSWNAGGSLRTPARHPAGPAGLSQKLWGSPGQVPPQGGQCPLLSRPCSEKPHPQGACPPQAEARQSGPRPRAVFHPLSPICHEAAREPGRSYYTSDTLSPPEPKASRSRMGPRPRHPAGVEGALLAPEEAWEAGERWYPEQPLPAEPTRAAYPSSIFLVGKLRSGAGPPLDRGS